MNSGGLSWLVMGRWERLHATHAEIPREDVEVHDVTVCGRRGWLIIPGLFSRLSLDRCAHCCRMTGVERGVGDPKNEEVVA